MINLLYCGNTAVFDGILISLLSILKNTNEDLMVYIITMDLSEIEKNNKPISEKQIIFLDKILKQNNCNNNIKRIDITKLFLEELGETVNMDNFYTPYCLLRLFVDEIEELPDKILYLDTDTVANDDINKLFSIDINSYEIAGVTDYLGKWFIDTDYMNSGVMLINIKLCKQTKLFTLARKRCISKKMAFPDQNAINTIANKKKYIDRKFNEQRKRKNNTVIQHFCKSIRWIPIYHTINVKPWEIEKVHKQLKIVEYDDILEQYITLIEDFKQKAEG